MTPLQIAIGLVFLFVTCAVTERIVQEEITNPSIFQFFLVLFAWIGALWFVIKIIFLSVEWIAS